MSAISTSVQATTRRRRKIRPLAVVRGAFAALVVWAVANTLVGDLRRPSFGSGAPHHLSAAVVIVAAVVIRLYHRTATENGTTRSEGRV